MVLRPRNKFRIATSTLFILSIYPLQRYFMFSNSLKRNSVQKDQSQLMHSVNANYQPRMNVNLQQNESPAASGRKLEFVHITKTGGSSIEHAAALAGINWGVCHFQQDKLAGCSKPPDITTNLEVTRFGDPSYWHQPLQYFRVNPYQNADTFTVVRNPYDRYLSEYYCPWGSSDGPTANKNDPDVMNEYLQRRIENHNHHHWLPQHQYIFDEAGNKIIDHVLHFESLELEFKDLMQKYNLNIVLPSTKTNARANDNRLKVKDLYPETLAAINRVAAMDFQLFGYKMLTL